MVAGADWANLTVAGAFVVGAFAGTIATIRVLRYLLTYLRRERDGNGRTPDPSDDPS